ncbi:MAG: preprotein translocase subunit SecE [Oscillospiraceae bacterium]|jgi:preprotein translocase subunit SecE|nr:preprotein translocase subunit SecE [Oscillospiraceae bacterium]
MSEKDIQKAKEKEKRENQKNAMKAAAAKRPRRSPFRFFKDAKAEFKKVTWPTPKQVVNNTGVVLTAIVITAAAIYGLDSVFAWILRFAYNVNIR